MNGLPPLPEQVNQPPVMPSQASSLPPIPTPQFQPPPMPVQPVVQPTPPSLPPTPFVQQNIQQPPERPKSVFFNLIIAVIVLIVLILIGYIVYTLVTSNQNQTGFNPIIIPNNNPTSSPLETSSPESNQLPNPEPVSNPITGTNLNWVRTQLSSTKGVTWDVEIPSTWQKVSMNTEQGYIVTTGDFNGGKYNVVFSYPNLSIYSNGSPTSLDDWVNKDKQLISSSNPQNLVSKPTTISGADAIIVTGIPQSTGANSSQANANQGIYTIIYIWIHNGVGPQQIIITSIDGRYDQTQMDALTDRIIQGIKF